MEQNINKVELQGRIGSVKVSNISGKDLARLSVATNYIYRSKDGDMVIETTWHNVTAWENGKTITGLQNLQKGDFVHVTGRLRTVRYTDSENIERVTSEIAAASLEVVKS